MNIGLPSLPAGLSPTAGTALLGMAGAALIGLFLDDYWGIVDQNGIPLIIVDNVVSVGYQNDGKVAQAPVQDGSFASYNKVASPYQCCVRMSKGGSVLERGAFLAMLEYMAGGTDLFTVITPETIYVNANIEAYDYRREASNGAHLIIADIKLTEIRQVKAKYTDAQDTSAAQSPAAASPAAGGTVQAQPVPANTVTAAGR
jgi:hypothetical protein